VEIFFGNENGTKMHGRRLLTPVGDPGMDETLYKVGGGGAQLVAAIPKSIQAGQTVKVRLFGKRIYAFCVGQDILVLDSDDGHLLSTIPLAHRNITGIRATYGLPLLVNYQEQNYLVTFAIIVEDSITGTDTLAIGVLDLKEEHPKLDVIETEPFVEDWYSVEGVGTTPDLHKAFFVWNDLWKVDYKTRKRDGQVSLPNSQAVPLIHPDGKKLYCGGQWHALAVYDVDSLKHIDDVELGHSMAGIGMRFVQTDKDLSAPGSTSQDP